MKEKTEVKKITASLIFSWIFGILFFLGGLTELKASILNGLLLFVAGLILLPPINKLLKEKMNFELSSWLKIVIIFVLLIIVGFNSATESIIKSSELNNNTVQEQIKQSTTPTIAETPIIKEKTATELTPAQQLANKKLTVKSVLEIYGYSVIRVDEGYLNSGSSYASVTMFSKGTSEEIPTQIGRGIGAVYGAWQDKEWYGVALNNGVVVCSFVIEGDKARDYMNKKINDIQLVSSIVSDCSQI